MENWGGCPFGVDHSQNHSNAPITDLVCFIEPATQVTIIRQQQQQQQMMIAEDTLSHSSSSSQAPLDQSMHSIDSLPPSSVHMLSSERFRASTRRRRQGQHPSPSSVPSQYTPSSLSRHLQRRELPAVHSVTTESTTSLKRTRFGLRSAWRKPA